MKKALSVFLGMMIIIGILAVGAAAEEVEEPVFNYSYKSGDIVDLQADIYPLLQKYIKTGVRSHVNIVFNADTTEPISGAGGEWDDDTYYPAGIKGVGIPLIDSLTFSGTGAILLDMNYAFSGRLLVFGSVNCFLNPLLVLRLAFTVLNAGDNSESDCKEDCAEQEHIVIILVEKTD